MQYKLYHYVNENRTEQNRTEQNRTRSRFIRGSILIFFMIYGYSYSQLCNPNCLSSYPQAMVICSDNLPLQNNIAKNQMLAPNPIRWDAKIKILKDIIQDSTLLQDTSYLSFYQNYLSTNLQRFSLAEWAIVQNLLVLKSANGYAIHQKLVVQH